MWTLHIHNSKKFISLFISSRALGRRGPAFLKRQADIVYITIFLILGYIWQTWIYTMASRIHFHIISVMLWHIFILFTSSLFVVLTNDGFPAWRSSYIRKERTNVTFSWRKMIYGKGIIRDPHQTKKITLPSGCSLHSNTEIDFLMPPWMTVTDVPFRK